MPIEERWLGAIATTAAIMLIIFCAVILIAAERSAPPSGSDGSSFGPAAPTVAFGYIGAGN